MQLDPLISLAFAMHENPGVYALLLGSGVSRSAGIFTGWEVVIDLARKLAALHDEDPEGNPAAWYLGKYGEEPRYDELLRQVGKTRAERSQLLRSYFEPSDDDRAEGRKLPREAHRAIARLAAAGYVRLILTTNFDPLIEIAVQEAGVSPDLITTEDALKGMRPLPHSGCTVVKLHGDYRDARIKNTADELAKYSKAKNVFLDRVLDEFGLVVCGWSAAYDVALCQALMRSPSRRYTTYWTVYAERVDEQAKKIVEQRNAVLVYIQDADSFFSGLADRIEALDAFRRPHPLSTESAVATAKKFLEDPERNRIKLEDLVTDEVEAVRKYATSPEFPMLPREPDGLAEAWKQQLQKYEASAERLLHILATVSWYDKGENSHLFTRALERLAEAPLQAGNEALLNLRLYPALLAIYGSGIASVAAPTPRRFAHLHAILAAPAARVEDRPGPVLKEMTPQYVLNYDLTKKLYGKDLFLPPNEHLFNMLRGPLRRYLSQDTDYAHAFSTFEFIFSLVYVDTFRSAVDAGGAFVWAQAAQEAWLQVVSEVARKQQQCDLLKTGLFGGSPQRFKESLGRYQENLRSEAGRWRKFGPIPLLVEWYEQAEADRSRS